MKSDVLSAAKSEVTKSLKEQSQVLDRLANEGLKEAKRLGADEVKIGVGVNFQNRLVVENKQLTLVSTLESRSVGIVVHKNQRKGSASINTVTDSDVKKAVADALALAEFSVPDPDLVLATPDEAPPAEDLPFLYDVALADFNAFEMRHIMVEVLDYLVRDPRVALDRFELSVDVSWQGLKNSLGVSNSMAQTMAGWSFFGMGRDGEQVTGFDYDGSFSYKASDLLEKCLKGAQHFTSKILGALNPKQAPSYKGAVLLSPRAVEELLVGMILYHAGGRQVMDGKSKWADAVGTKVMSPLLTLVDDPHDPEFSGAATYDGDGLPTRRQTILKAGVLEKILHDCYSAKKCSGRSKVLSTATAGGPFACRFAAGESGLQQLKASHDTLLLVDRFSGNSDPVKGDFSGVAKSSRLIKKGHDKGPVMETMIAGNFFDMAHKILGVSREVEMVGGGFRSPYILVDGVSVTGAG